jgi:hypothetical protein
MINVSIYESVQILHLFKVALLTFSAVNMIAAQDLWQVFVYVINTFFSLVFRYLIIRENKNFFNLFMKFRFVIFLLVQIVAVCFGVELYFGIGNYEVNIKQSKLLLFLRKHNILLCIRKFKHNRK